MKKLLIAILFLLVSLEISYGFYSKYLLVEANSLEYHFLKNHSTFSLKRGGLIASGVGEKEVQAYLRQMNNIQKSILQYKDIGRITKKRIQNNKTREKIATLIFDYLHQKEFKKYQEESTTLNELLKTGNFNCLSSTLMYLILLKKNSINAKIVALPSHVFTTIQLSKKIIDVETVVPTGFDFQSKYSYHNGFKNLTGFNYNPDLLKRKTLSKWEIFAYIFANRAALAAKANQPKKAFQLALRVLAMSDNKNIPPNVVESYILYSSFLSENKKYDFAQAVLGEFIKQFPNEKTVINHYEKLLNIEISNTCASNRFDVAFTKLKKAESIARLKLIEIREYIHIQKISHNINTTSNYNIAYTDCKQALTELPNSLAIKQIILFNYRKLLYINIKNPSLYKGNEDLILKWNLLQQDKLILEKYYSAVVNYKIIQKDYKKAYEIFQKTIILYPKSKTLKNLILKNAKESLKHNKSEADILNTISYYKKAMQYNPKHSTQIKKTIAKLYHFLANKAIKKKQYKKAKKYVDVGLKILPNNKELLLLRKNK